jgi:hypothetical protein
LTELEFLNENTEEQIIDDSDEEYQYERVPVDEDFIGVGVPVDEDFIGVGKVLLLHSLKIICTFNWTNYTLINHLRREFLQRLNGDMIEIYKYLHHLQENPGNILELDNNNRTRGHSFKLMKPRNETNQSNQINQHLKTCFFARLAGILFEPWAVGFNFI